ncbi:hypothetical protein T4A_2666 [Trichinella pseudospiralis]|uniref:MULE transposase domain-containing protein n=1 Tax=Trichinella pseudospiralis TaxID=6337 RepID=A0A0V1DSX0_TRIPS|nr:hypothetical protein T4A_2666 [Trichinella pseudospiralis]
MMHHAFHHDQQLSELKRLAAEDPRPVSEIYDELASNITTILDTAAYFRSWDQDRTPCTTAGPKDTHDFRPGGRIRGSLPSKQQQNPIVPSWYQQFFTLHVFMRGELLPVVYCLTVRKDLSTYSRIFEVVYFKAEVELGVQLDPAKFVCDFETALITAIQSNFPNTRLQGCFFHFCQAVVLQVGRLGLGNHYANNQELRKKVKMLMAISIFAGESSARGVRNLKCWGVG